ncbi:maestro heat-like repeat family member 5 isoform X1 [Dipodomys merriami]|uniref:maestro heat-like repeat family member 5 isoform X1 n=1 Tax=Dipodomys merriami TaxID=94247 RepID=UPI003855EA3F
MLGPPSDGFHMPAWRSTRLSPREEQELELDNSDVGLAEELWSQRPPWEGTLLGRIRTMMAMEQSLALETICRCLDEHSQNPEKQVSVFDSSVHKFLEFLGLDPKKSEEKAFLFRLYGLILRECASSERVEHHLACLLELSHQPSSQREGIALAVGLASARHLKEVWALLEHLGRTRFLRSVVTPEESQQPDLRWKWVSSTSLLCYGQMATHAREQILPWVDNIASRMVYYFSCSPCDEVLNASFLTAAILLTRALRREYGAQNYKFTQTPELIHCLLSMLQKEPNFLATLLRQKIILVIVGLSNLRPSLKPVVKSRVLQMCLRSVYSLPPPEALRSSLPPLEPAPDVMALYKKTERALDLLLQNFVSENPSMDEVCFLLQHMEHWLESEMTHEVKRAVQSIFLLLQHVVGSMKFGGEAMPSILGHQIGLLTLLWRDRDECTHYHAHQCVFLLLQLMAQQKGVSVDLSHWNKMKNFEAKASKDWEVKLSHTAKALEEGLTVAQHTQLVLTLLQSLCGQSQLRCDLASKLLQLIFSTPSIRTEQVAEILHGLFRELPSIQFKSIQQTMMKAVLDLGLQHTQEVVEVILSLCHPSERRLLSLWKALAAQYQLARKVITLLYMKLKLRPPMEHVRTSHQVQLISLLALGTIYELLYTQEYRETVRWAFAGILLGLLTQLHYLFELGFVEGISDYEEDILEARPLGPCRTCLEALKGLFWTTHYWEVFAHIKLLQGWELFEHVETYTEGVTLLARTMTQYNCEVKAVLGQAVIFLKSVEERDNVVAILIITEFLNSPDISQHTSRKTISSSLSLGLNNPNKWVRASSLSGLSSTLMHPKKVTLLRSQLMGLLEAFLQPDPKDLLGLMQILGDLLRRLGMQGVGALSLKVAQHLLLLFEDERAEVREGAIFLFGDVIHSSGHKCQQALKALAVQALVPLLFHLLDSSPRVVMRSKLTLLRCAIVQKWEFRKELFSKLAWGRGLGAENDIFIYMVESNFGSYHQFLMQAFTYLGSSQNNLKVAAMKFIGGMLQDYFTDLCFYLKKSDVKILKNHLEALSQDTDSTCRRFYRRSLADIVELSYFVT